MKIADAVVEIVPGRSHRLSPRPPRFGTERESYRGLLRIIADDGAEGNCIFGNSPIGFGGTRERLYLTATQILDTVRKELLGKSMMDREWLWNRGYLFQWWGALPHLPLSIIDQALWDAVGKAAGLPVCQLLGLERHKIPAYASAQYYSEPRRYVELAEQCKKLGYQAYKIKPGGGGVPRIKNITKEVREAVGDDMALMLDAQMQFSLEESLDIGHHLQDLGYTWLEDAMPHTDLHAYENLCRRLDIPIAYTDHGAFRFAHAAGVLKQVEGLRILRGDVSKDGITGLKKLCSFAEGHGLKCEIHSSGLGNLHVALSVANCDYYEDIMGRDRVSEQNEVIPRSDSDPFRVDEEGCLHAPTSPGLGLGDVEHMVQGTIDTLRATDLNA